MHELEIEQFKKLTYEERISLLSKLKEEVKAIKKKVLYDEGPVISGRTFHKSPLRNEWEEKEKRLIFLEKEHNNLMKG
jgi:hypothetical protein